MTAGRIGRISLTCALVLGLLTFTSAVNVGDEMYATSNDGRFYVFADKAIHVIDPTNASVVANITTDQAGNALTGSNSSLGRVWNDAVYLQKASIGAQLVLVNEGDTYSETNGTLYTYTSVIDTTTRSIIGRVKVGARAAHIYAVNRTSVAWVHSDDDGYFYLIDVTSRSPFQANVSRVKAFENTPGHGKLIINDALFPIAYSTNVNENVIIKYDVTNNTRLGSYNFTSQLTNQSCSGTHSAWYSRINQHIYFECGTTGIFEWNTRNNTLVRQYNLRGTITATPGDDRIFITDTSDRVSTVLDPVDNGVPSTIETTITVSSQPGDPAYYANSSSSAPRPYNEYTAFFPTARNTNLNNIRVAGNGNIQTREYYQKPTDCTYQDTVTASSVGSSTGVTGLRLAANTNQSCGACAAGIATLDPSQFNATLAGFRIYDVGSTEDTAVLISAGAVSPAVSAASGANQCSFASPSRVAKRGGLYVATNADFPQPSIYIVQAGVPFGRGAEIFVRTAIKPRKIVWVPSTIRPTG